MNQRPDPHFIRRIVLPSGRSVEIVRLIDKHLAPRPLHVCPACASHLVQPVRWGAAPNDLWELTLECPNCCWHGEGVFDRDRVDLLEEELDDGLAQMLSDLRRLTQANMTEDVERFVAALDAGLILPEDF